MMPFLLALILCLSAGAADPSSALLSAAASGKTAEVQALLEKGASIEAQDKSGRTPLMLAAQHGHADTVRLLLQKGAHADARDRSGLTAFGLTLLSPAGRGDHEAALKALPQPPPLRVAVDAGWSPAHLASSCFMSPEELRRFFTDAHFESLFVKELSDYSRTAGRGVVDLTNSGDPDARIEIQLQPGAKCEAATGDSLTFSIDVKVVRAKDQKVLLEKSFGGGFKGLRTQTVTNIAQYSPVFLAWLKPQAQPVYWAAVETLLRN